jgi:hypothetical protein
MQCSLVGDGKFVGSHGQAAPQLEAVDAPFDRSASSAAALAAETSVTGTTHNYPSPP